MPKPDMQAALKASLQGEEQAVADRFAKADTFFSSPEPPSPPKQLQEQSLSDSRQPKVVRDGFTMPAEDYALIAQIQAKSLQAGLSATKSEVLRAGLHALHQMPLEDLIRALKFLTKLKPGRPSTKS
jgi:hypothetical protein